MEWLEKFNFIMDFKSAVLNNLNPQDYHFYGLWKQDLFSASFWVNCFDQEILQKIGLFSNELGSLDLSRGNFFVKHSECENIQNQVKTKILNNDAMYFKKMIAEIDQIYQSALTIVESLKSKEPDESLLLDFYKQARNVNLLWIMGAAHFVVVAEKMLQETVIEESFPAEQLHSIIPQVKTPLYYQNQEARELKKLIGGKSLDEVKSDTFLLQKITRHLQTYSWVEMANFIGEPLTVERLYEQVAHMTAATDEAQITHPASKKLLFRAQCMHDAGYLKQMSAETFSMLIEKIRPFLEKIAKKFNISYRELINLRDVEVQGLLGGSIAKKHLSNLLSKRLNNDWVVFSNKNNEVVFCDEPQDIKILEEQMLPKAESSYELRGQVGCPGKVTGIVKVIMTSDDFTKMQPGDILVTTMTTPDFVILMQKAGAIVTDIGGLLSHAAIVSREIKKPCVIGTKFATHFFKDGDLVEVDAIKGVVKKI